MTELCGCEGKGWEIFNEDPESGRLGEVQACDCGILPDDEAAYNSASAAGLLVDAQGHVLAEPWGVYADQARRQSQIEALRRKLIWYGRLLGSCPPGVQFFALKNRVFCDRSTIQLDYAGALKDFEQGSQKAGFPAFVLPRSSLLNDHYSRSLRLRGAVGSVHRRSSTRGAAGRKANPYGARSRATLTAGLLPLGCPRLHERTPHPTDPRAPNDQYREQAGLRRPEEPDLQRRASRLGSGRRSLGARLNRKGEHSPSCLSRLRRFELSGPLLPSESAMWPRRCRGRKKLRPTIRDPALRGLPLREHHPR